MDLSADPTLPAMIDMLRQLTRADSSREVLTTFMGRYSRVRPVDYFVGVVQVAGEAGAYRILYSLSAEEMNQPGRAHPRDMDPSALARLPVHRGGAIGALIEEPLPKLALGLDLGDDPQLGASCGGHPTCMALPMFEGDTVAEWTLSFSRMEEGFFQARDVGQASLTANLLNVANRNFDSLQTIRGLNGRLRDQLDQIARVQQSLLPARTPDIPTMEIATSYLTSNESGGDYYDFFPLGGGRWGILIADVSGHGAAAATIMAMLHAILHCYGSVAGWMGGGGAHDPAAAMRFANARLYETGLDGSFVTAFFAVFDPHACTLTFSNCGHPPPRRRDALTGRVETLDGAATLPLGIVEEFEPETRTVAFAGADTLLLFTDGITEAFSPSGEMYGDARLERALAESDGQPDAVIDAIHRTLYEHRGSATRDDDQTIVVMRYHGTCVIGGEG